MKIFLKVFPVVVLFALLFSAWRVYGIMGVTGTIGEEDIYYTFLEGQRILNGENPYERVLSSDMLHNDKYATYFPLFFELSAATQKLGLDQFDAWLVFWRRVFIAFNLGTAALLFYLFHKVDMDWIGVFAAAFWLFNRWTLKVVSIVHLDFTPILFMVASLAVFPKKQRLGLLLYSVSLGLKQIGIIILPLYLVWVWHSSDKNRVRNILVASLLIGSVPLLTSIPFLVWNAKGFIMSVLFSVTRLSGGSLSVISLDEILGWRGVMGRLPMFVLFISVYWMSFARSMRRYTAAFFVMSVFVSFNGNLYAQYMLWLVPLTLLLLLDSKETFFIKDAGV